MAKPKRRELWKISYGDEQFTLYNSDFTVGRLRQMGQWYGPLYAKFSTLVQLLIEGDANAWACAIWVAHHAAGLKCRRPQDLDFAISDVMQDPDAEDEDDEFESEDDDAGADPSTVDPQ